MYSSILEKLRVTLHNVINTAIDLNISDTKLDEMASLCRSVEITSLLANGDYIAIAGTQGAGKTTLAKSLFNIDAEWLLPNIGRGEQIPLFIEESAELKKPYITFVYSEQGNTLEKKTLPSGEKITAKDLDVVLKSWDSLAKFNTETQKFLYPKLYIPTTFQQIAPLKWILLPGYELIDYKNAVWQNFMRHALQIAKGVIFVTDKSLLANDNQSLIIDDIKKTLDGRSPVVAIPRSESFSEEDKFGLVETVEQAFSMDDGQPIEVVFTNNNKISVWKGELEAALLNARFNNATCDAILLEQIKNFSFKIKNISSALEELAIQKSIPSSEQQIVNELMDVFQKSVEDYEKVLEKQLRDQYASHIKRAIADASDKYEKSEEGAWNNIKILGQRLIGKGHSIERERNKRIEAAFYKKHREQGTKYAIAIQDCSFAAIRGTNAKKLQEYNGIISSVEDYIGSNNTQELLGYQNNSKLDAKSDGFDNNELMNKNIIMLQNIFYGQEQNLIHLDVNETKSNIKEAFNLLPVLAMEYARINLSYQLGSDSNSEGGRHDKIMSPEILISEVQKGFGNYKPLLVVFLGLLGVDAADGRIDGKYNSSTTGKDDTDSPAISPIALVGKLAAAIAVTTMVYGISQKITDSDRYQHAMIHNNINSLANASKQAVLDKYNDAMLDLKKLLQFRLENMYGIEDHFSHKHNIALLLKDLTIIQKDIRRYGKDAKSYL